MNSYATRLGLRPKNSPSLAVLQQKKSADNSILSFSPSKFLSKPPISPAFSIAEENKENAETQTLPVETVSVACQTDVVTCGPLTEVTIEDLKAKEPTLNYLKSLMKVYENQAEEEYESFLMAQLEEEESIHELEQTREALDMLKEIGEDIAREQADNENSSH